MILATQFNDYEKGEYLLPPGCGRNINAGGAGDLFTHMTSLLGTGVFNSDGLYHIMIHIHSTHKFVFRRNMEVRG